MYTEHLLLLVYSKSLSLVRLATKTLEVVHINIWTLFGPNAVGHCDPAVQKFKTYIQYTDL